MSESLPSKTDGEGWNEEICLKCHRIPKITLIIIIICIISAGIIYTISIIAFHSSEGGGELGPASRGQPRGSIPAAASASGARRARPGPRAPASRRARTSRQMLHYMITECYSHCSGLCYINSVEIKTIVRWPRWPSRSVRETGARLPGRGPLSRPAPRAGPRAGSAPGS